MLKQKTPMKASSKPLARSAPMKRGSVPLIAKKPIARGSVALARNAAPMRSRSKTNSTPRPATGEAKLCKGQPCYLRIPGICTGQAHDPCHSNQAIHGKGKGIKAHDEYTVPGCRPCHNELDQGMRYSRIEKFDIWDRAYAAWKPVRAALMLAKSKPIPSSESVAP